MPMTGAELFDLMVKRAPWVVLVGDKGVLEEFKDLTAEIQEIAKRAQYRVSLFQLPAKNITSSSNGGDPAEAKNKVNDGMEEPASDDPEWGDRELLVEIDTQRAIRLSLRFNPRGPWLQMFRPNLFENWGELP